MNPGQRLIIQLVTNDGEQLRLSRVVPQVRFFTNGHYRYGFLLPGTDADGRVVVNFGDIEARRAADALESLMDYNTPLQTCDDVIEVRVQKGHEMEDSFKVASRWGKWSPEMSEWPLAANKLISAEPVKALVLGEETFVYVRCKPA